MNLSEVNGVTTAQEVREFVEGHRFCTMYGLKLALEKLYQETWKLREANGLVLTQKELAFHREAVESKDYDGLLRMLGTWYRISRDAAAAC